MKSLDISGRSLKLNSASDVQPFIDDLQATPAEFDRVILSGNTIGVDACRALASALAQLVNLRVCQFSDIFTGRLRSEIPLCLEAFTAALKDKLHLEELDLSDNAFGPDGLRPVVPLISALCSLRILRVNNTGLGPAGGLLLAQALRGLWGSCQAAGVESKLETVVCGRSRLENGSMKELADSLQSHSHLRRVSFPQDGIRPEGVAVLLKGLAKCGELEELDLQDNTFTRVGAEALAEVLPSWPRLIKLNVGDCMLTARGSMAVFERISEKGKSLLLPHLEHFNLQFNEIDEKGALFLATILVYLPKLKSLELNGNCFAEDSAGAEAIRSTLELLGKGDDVLGSMSDMEEEDSDNEEEEEAEVEEEEEEVIKALAGL
eukprot:Partr_v1_DN27349_c1_g1_i1_m46303 putative RAN GTPase activating protein 1